MKTEDFIKDILKSGDFEIYGNSQVKKINYTDVNVTKNKFYDLPTNLSEWSSSHFVYYTRSLFLNQFPGKRWELNYISARRAVNILKDELLKVFGYCTNSMLKVYIKYFFDFHAEAYFKQYGEFYFTYLRSNFMLRKFETFFKQKTDIVLKTDNQLNAEDIKNSFLLGTERLLADFGIVITYYWLKTFEKLSDNDIIKEIRDICLQLLKKNQIYSILNRTLEYAPYPKWMRSDQINFLSSEIGLPNLDFKDVKRFNFLLKENM